MVGCLGTLVRQELLSDTVAFQLLQSLATGKSVGLREEVAHELVVIAHWLAVEVFRRRALTQSDEFCRNGAALEERAGRITHAHARAAARPPPTQRSRPPGA